MSEYDLKDLKIPNHLAIIMDGNGRWAKKRGMPRTYGHSRGAKAMERVADACAKFGVKYLTVFAFSSENWDRPKEEVDFLMKIFSEYLDGFMDKLSENEVRVRIIGQQERFSKDIYEKIQNIEEKTKKYNKYNLTVALSYGGQQDIANAAKKIAMQVKEGNLKVEDIDKETVKKNLWTSELPPIDLLIRTSGEQRISNFLLWDLSYAEFLFMKPHWPAFNAKILKEAIVEFTKRDRRFGKV